MVAPAQEAIFPSVDSWTLTASQVMCESHDKKFLKAFFRF